MSDEQLPFAPRRSPEPAGRTVSAVPPVRRRADPLPTRVIATAAGVAATLGLVIILVPPETQITPGSAGVIAPAPSDDGSSTFPAVGAADVVESPAPSPVKNAAAKASAKATSKAKATAIPKAATTKSRATSGSTRTTPKATPKPAGVGTTPAPTARATPPPTPKPTPPPTPKPTPVPTAASGKP